MEELANRHWDGTGSGSRITWVKSVVKRYFLDGDWKRVVRRAKRRAGALAARPSGLDIPDADEAKSLRDIEDDARLVIGDKLRTLDVGSCYNPFRDVEFMDVTAIDLSPATGDVYACDFLTAPIVDEDDVEVSDKEGKVSNGGSRPVTVTSLPKGRYDVVIFCLLLEYIPTPGLRYEAVKRAVELLTDFGILVIVTPDSSHQVGWWDALT